MLRFETKISNFFDAPLGWFLSSKVEFPTTQSILKVTLFFYAKKQNPIAQASLLVV